MTQIVLKDYASILPLTHTHNTPVIHAATHPYSLSPTPFSHKNLYYRFIHSLRHPFSTQTHPVNSSPRKPYTLPSASSSNSHPVISLTDLDNSLPSCNHAHIATHPDFPHTHAQKQATPSILTHTYIIVLDTPHSPGNTLLHPHFPPAHTSTYSLPCLGLPIHTYKHYI